MDSIAKRIQHHAEKGNTPNKRAMIRMEKLLIKAGKYFELAINPDSDANAFTSYLRQAEALCNESLDIFPIPEQFTLLVRINLELGKLDQAIYWLNRANEQFFEDASVLNSAGQVAIAQGKLNHAIRYFKQSIEIDNQETNAKQSLAFCYYLNGQSKEAFKLYQELAKTQLNNPAVSQYLFETMNHIIVNTYDEELEADLLRYLELEKADHFLLGNTIWSLIKAKYSIKNDITESTIKAVCNDRLFIQSITKVQVCDPLFEKLVCAIRYDLLKRSIEDLKVENSDLAIAMALQGHMFNNEYVYFITDEEANVIQHLRVLIEGSMDRAIELQGAILIYSLYEPLHELKGHETLVKLSAQFKPFMQEGITNTVATTMLEAQEAKQLERTLELNTISTAVRDQYENNPYPRWTSLPFSTATLYSRALEKNLLGYKAPAEFDNAEMEILIAGAGTGKHALYMASYFRNVKVTAVDLSTHSLAYAKKMAQRLGVDNIQFIHANLLNLNLDKKFDVIECSGVLHHTSDSDLGLANLVKHLKPRGVIKLGLYSQRAREWIYKLKDIINNQAMPASRKNIRVFRRAIHELPQIKELSMIRNSVDFYSYSGCRDLLFHVHEVAYTPVELSNFINRQGLRFLGFVNLPTHVQIEYSKQFPADQTRTNLACWDKYERDHPKTFSRMYQFYVERRR